MAIAKPTIHQKKSAVRYAQARGGRKTANAYARVSETKNIFTVNDRDYKEYFKSERNRAAAIAPLTTLNVKDKMGASVRVSGGGINAQADAVRNATARALVKFDESYRAALKQAGFLTRDARMVERKKYGLKKARRAPQWAKR
ncbi:MAG: 30S ribosomal protein S9 [Candidatus Harrisonbacteria bacterium RIFOXYA1_FULL_48_8]|uniref:30S ribosomal protein S9 n=3 Tax=Parcubacteria group TaxID=1794811 RepID=A0A0G1T5V8_9BACT|nr:MAG: 30S ribosomal protein S9 [Candidatus Giovannonibacteria bacterium GW2011_GWB1_47_6b]KKU92221.1 MAG: 30S ribosomal protein S9 [Parcubacteria group bacterium GW2011_GWA1_48_11b]OGY64044.1 MAG: 30S ribosomal protein S9 [Candidatus Harrisonbacteria bacterium RIFCSPHIGHO2_12_FULL_48_16]OGY69213.1 MAG: 30S ribosomal protein S9 [Candidatus Harrisonbacteria bacterium RIFOXYA1_FULL_48_8]